MGHPETFVFFTARKATIRGQYLESEEKNKTTIIKLCRLTSIKVFASQTHKKFMKVYINKIKP